MDVLNNYIVGSDQENNIVFMKIADFGQENR